MTVLLLVSLLVLLPAATGFLSAGATLWPLHSSTTHFGIGAPVVYREDEASTCPSADARDIHPAPNGDFYYYSVTNYLRVSEILNDGRIIAVARDKKRRCFWPDDSSLRKARWTERLIYRPRFPHL